ncbi:GntR family transcriptional regulator [Anaerosporobacter sp.]|uniref:GntR family transcriptional regulator n=1 Tax=Anaerosporobacter sp. TaxID=1872529 RepID=UPI00286F826B|nr:GntR family transcriptional regulator [Anaerosporobacter sp.]
MIFDNTVPIYLQVIRQIKMDLIQGKLQLGEKMLSTRELALAYQINPNTVSRIYKELELEGICFTKRGLGTYVTENKEILITIKEEMAKTAMTQFVESMRDIGFTKEDVLRLIEQQY